MPRTTDINLLKLRYKLMLELQQEIHNEHSHWFPPSTRELMVKWNLYTTSAVDLTLNHLDGYGLLATKRRGLVGKSRSYFAIKTLQKAEEVLDTLGEKL